MTDVLRILVGPLVWLASFSAVYGLHGIACSFGWGGTDFAGTSLLRLVLLIAWLCAIGTQVVIIIGLSSRWIASPSGFVGTVSRMTAWAGLVATLWTLFPAAATSSCA